MGFVSDVVDGITGKSGSKAAEKASQQQYQSTQDAINFERESRDLARGDLQPYADAGKARLGTLSALADQPADTGYNALTEALGSARPDWTGAMIHGALQNYGMPTTNISRVGDVGTSGFGTGPEAESVLQGENGRTNWSDRLQEVSNTSYRDLQGFNDASDAMSRQVMGNNAARGKLGSGATLNDLFQQNAAMGESMRGNLFNETQAAANTDESQFNNAFSRRLSDAGYRESVRANQAGEALSGMGINANIRNSMVGENYGIAALNQAAVNDAYNRTMGIANFDENVDNNAFSRLFDTQSFGQQANNTNFTQNYNLANMGQNAAAGQGTAALNTGIADLYTQGGNALAAGTVGSQNATNSGTNNLINLAAMAYTLSDRRLKTSIERIGANKGLGVYRYRYTFNPEQAFIGYMADEVEALYPHAVAEFGGYKAVSYGAI